VTRALVVALVLLGFTAPAQAKRVAILVANDRGAERDVALKFAESDAGRLARLLTRLGGFADEATILVRGRTVGEIRRAFAEAARQLGPDGGDDVVFLYYSGHADGEALHIGDERLPLAELKAMTLALPAAARILVVDACQAGALTRAKGGRPGLAFAVESSEAPPRGLAILASSTAAELAQESDEIGGSFFTHYLLAGLAGAADQDHDGRVSLAEAFDFSSRRTLVATIGSAVGPQHPTFRFDLTGERDVVLTYPTAAGTGFGRLRVDRPGWFFLRRAGDHAVTEIVSEGHDELALEPGSYEVSQRLSDRLELAELEVVGREQVVALSGVSTRSVAYARVVRKGGVRDAAFGVAALAGARSDVASLGPGASATLLARVDWRPGSLELRGGLERAVYDGRYVTTVTSNVFVAAAALRAADLRRFTVSGGVEAGWAGFFQTVGGVAASGLSHAALAGPLASAELPVGRRFSLRADVELPVFLVRERAASGSELRVRFAARVGLGAGVSF
jgi:hypothetical protein